ncbi:hypothetical protein J3Q64DRAFT_1733762, partial [Phycomyces blakesleeanus]
MSQETENISQTTENTIQVPTTGPVEAEEQKGSWKRINFQEEQDTPTSISTPKTTTIPTNTATSAESDTDTDTDTDTSIHTPKQLAPRQEKHQGEDDEEQDDDEEEEDMFVDSLSHDRPEELSSVINTLREMVDETPELRKDENESIKIAEIAAISQAEAKIGSQHDLVVIAEDTILEEEEEEAEKDAEHHDTIVPIASVQVTPENNRLSCEDDSRSDSDKTLEVSNSEPGSPITEDNSTDKLNIVLPTEGFNRALDVPADKNMADFVTPPTPGAAPKSDPSHYDDENDCSQISNTNVFPIGHIDMKNVKANYMGPRHQEKYDIEMLHGVNAFFNNKFSKAKGIFEKRASKDPLYALGLGAMAFVKAITSSDSSDTDVAIQSLTETYAFASAQIDDACANKPLIDTVSHYFTNLMGSNPTHLPTNTKPLKQDKYKDPPIFISNGALRAHVIRAECCLLIGLIHMTKESVVGYLKMGLNLRRAYSSYSLVWQEYKRMGQHFNRYMDQDTISAIQYGIGSVHLLLSSLPPKILKIVAAFGWQADKHLGFALLKLCLEGRRIRSPLASLTLLSYYVSLTSCAPQILARDLIQPAVECLLDAQKTYPNSSFFLYFAGCVSRLAKNIPLSTQSFMYTFKVSQGGWAEVTMGHMATYEIAFNSAMSLDWASAAVRILELQSKHTNSPVFLKFFYGACMEMLGNRTEAILSFAAAPHETDKKKRSQVDQYISRRVEFFEQSGYQDIDLCLPGLEILFLWNSFANMTPACLESCLEQVDTTLELVYEREKQEYELRVFEVAPNTPPPDYYEQRASLLVMKASILNALERHREAIVHLNWVLDHKERIKPVSWIVPFAYWESGVTCWGVQDYKRARAMWETSQSFSNYDLEFRLSIRLNLVITHAIDLGVPETIAPKPEKGRSTQGRKRMSIVHKLTGSVSS